MAVETVAGSPPGAEIRVIDPKLFATNWQLGGRDESIPISSLASQGIFFVAVMMSDG